MISILSQDIINKIAAGEVIERPASVVKELTENAADAEAKKIEITLECGGIKLIQVRDDGCGMNESDAKMCLLPHTTSKLRSAEDLFRIRTLGFRGEALASISAVSQFSLVTKQADTLEGYLINLNADKQPSLKKTAANKGTTITVANLFYTIPARQKFLKTPGTEFTHVLRYLQQFALIHPEIELILRHNGKNIFNYSRSSWQERVEQVLGKVFTSKLIPLSIQSGGMKIEGFVAKPALVHATHKNQYLFVNQRPVYDYLINRAVLEGYETLVPRGYFPAFVIKLDLDPRMVDVNVHPRKSEVKFLNSSHVIQFLKSSVKKSLNESDIITDQVFQSADPIKKTPSNGIAYRMLFGSRPSDRQIRQALDFSQEFSGHLRHIKKSPLEDKGWRIIGQIHLSFILVETTEGLQLMDQHAVSEIVNYQRLIEERSRKDISSQRLLIPLMVDVTPEELSILEENREVFTGLGWDIDQLNTKSIQISALPEILKVENVSNMIHEVLNKFKDDKSVDIGLRELALLKFEACRGAVMFGDPLSVEEMRALINQWLKVKNNVCCEHGRPAVARITIREMKKYFKR